MNAKEALERLYRYIDEGSYLEEFETIETALNRLEELEETNHLMFLREHRTSEENRKLEKVLSFIKEHVLLDGSILRANFQWDLDIEENGEVLKEYLQ